MIKGVTKSGFAFELEDGAMDDMELIDALAETMGDNPLAVSRVVKILLTKDQRKKLYEHNRTESGRVSATAVLEDVKDMFSASQQGKNS